MADLLVGASLPYHAIFFITPGLSRIQYPCYVRFTTIILTAAASILNLLVIAIDRYSMIPTYHPSTHTIEEGKLVKDIFKLSSIY